MSTIRPDAFAGEDARATLLILEQLGDSIAVSLEAVTHESLPEEMGLLLLRMALAEVLRQAAEEAARDAGTEPCVQEWLVGLRRWAAATSASASWTGVSSG